MNLTSVLLYPIALLLPAAGAGDGVEGGMREGRVQVSALPDPAQVPDDSGAWPQDVPAAAAVHRLAERPFASLLLRHAEPEDAAQIRIEQRMQIRITPRTPSRLPPDMFMSMPTGDAGGHMTERKIGKCLTIASIAGVQPDRSNRLLLFTRDRRMITAELERSCRARDFYSGFYMSRTPDGRLCVDRDTLLSRSGMNCKLTRIRELVEDDD